MAKFSYITEDNIFDTYRKSVKYMDSYLNPVDEQERIARNQPHPGLDKSYPQVTDGTTSSIIQKTPRRIVQQIPTGRVKSDKNDWLSVVASFIYTNRIIPNANQQNALIDKCWRMIRGAMTHGAAHSSAPFINRGEYFGTDMTVHYIKNVKFQEGKLSDLESNCIFIEGWFQPSDIQAIIDKEKELKKDPDYESTWDLKNLVSIKDLITAKSDEEKSNSQKKNSDDTTKSGVKLVTALQSGLGAVQFTFHPSSELVVRRKKNKDPRGEMNLQTMYYETDGINPLGRGIVEQVGSLQNLMDSEMQMYQFNRALSLAPPMVKRGNWNKTQAKLAPNVLIDLGVEPNNSLEPLKIDTSAIANFPQNYGLMKSQLLNLTASPDTSISSEVGNPGFSKTPAGVNAIQSNVSVDDNYIRKQFEAWFERWSETAINLYFAERSGVEELQLDEQTAQRLRKLEQEGSLEPGFVSDDNKILIDYDSATEALTFEVDASTSNMKNDQQQLEALDSLLERVQNSPILQQAIPQEKILGAWNAIVSATGVENPEEMSIDLKAWKEEQKQMQQQQAMQEQAMAQAANAPLDIAQEQPDTTILPPASGMDEPMAEEAIPQEETSDEDLAFIQALQDMGYSDEKIQQALGMDQMGIPNDEIIQVLEMSSNG